MQILHRNKTLVGRFVCKIFQIPIIALQMHKYYFHLNLMFQSVWGIFSNLKLLQCFQCSCFPKYSNKSNLTINCWTSFESFSFIRWWIWQSKWCYRRKKGDKSHIVEYQLLCICIKCLMFCKHITSYFYMLQNWKFWNKQVQWTWFGGAGGSTCPKIKAGACVETTLVILQYGSKSNSSKKINANIGATLIRTDYIYEKSAQ
jgi:hypothetical protein